MSLALNPLVQGSYVHYKGRIWLVDYNSLLDAQGRASLVSLRDASQGIQAPPNDCTYATEAETRAIEWFLANRS